MKSPLVRFQWPWASYDGRFPSKIALPLKKVCYKVSLCELLSATNL